MIYYFLLEKQKVFFNKEKKMFKINNGNLTGKCLISSPYMEDEHFGHSVVYICSHGKEGAMGFIINKRIEDVTFSDLANQLPLKSFAPTQDIALHQGGPLERIRGFVLHSTDYIKEDTVVIDKSIAVSSSIDIINDIAFGTGPKDNIIALGYSSWKPEQLEQEIIRNDWIISDSEPELVFRTKDEDKWSKALELAGIDAANLASYSGRA